MKDIPQQDQRDVANLLRSHNITPTAQRVDIARVLFSRAAHFSAEDVYKQVNENGTPSVSKATVYNTLGLFVDKRLIRMVLVDPSKVFYDSNTIPHHHFYDVDNGKLQDITGDQVAITGLPSPPPGTELHGVDLVVRVRRSD